MFQAIPLLFKIKNKVESKKSENISKTCGDTMPPGPSYSHIFFSSIFLEKHQRFLLFCVKCFSSLLSQVSPGFAQFFHEHLSSVVHSKMKFPLVSNFLCCLDLKIGCYLLGIVDCLLYGLLTIFIVLQLAFDIEFFDKGHGKFHRSMIVRLKTITFLWFQLLSTTICFHCCF